MSSPIYFSFMNKDNMIGTLSVGKNYIKIMSGESMLMRFIPDIEDWIYCRNSPVGRDNIKLLLKLAGINNLMGYLSVTHSLSLTDTFWVKPMQSDLTWEKVNPFTNRFSRVISAIALDGGYPTGSVRSPSPDYTVDGTADKCFKRVNGTIYLYKTSGERWGGVSGNRPYCEYYASQVARQLVLDKSHIIEYKMSFGKTHGGNIKPYVFCPIFTTEEIGFLPLCDSYYRSMTIPQLDRHLPTKDRVILREMLLLDSIILNCDRHDGNYGFLYNNDTLKFERLAPIFDNDCSLGYNVSLQFKELSEAYSEAYSHYPRTEMGDYLEQARWTLTDQLISNMRNMYPFHFKRLPKEVDLEDRRIQFMEGIVNTQIKRILSTVKN